MTDTEVSREEALMALTHAINMLDGKQYGYRRRNNEAGIKLIDALGAGLLMQRMRSVSGAYLQGLQQRVKASEEDYERWATNEPKGKRFRTFGKAVMTKLRQLNRGASLTMDLSMKQLEELLERLDDPGRVA